MIQIYSSEYSSTSGKYLVTHWPQDLCPDSGQFAWLVTQAMLNIVNSSEMYVMCFVDRTFVEIEDPLHMYSFDSSQYISSHFFSGEV